VSSFFSFSDVIELSGNREETVIQAMELVAAFFNR